MLEADVVCLVLGTALFVMVLLNLICIQMGRMFLWPLMSAEQHERARRTKHAKRLAVERYQKFVNEKRHVFWQWFYYFTSGQVPQSFLDDAMRDIEAGANSTSCAETQV